MSEPLLPSAGPGYTSKKFLLINGEIIDVEDLTPLVVYMLPGGKILSSKNMTMVPAETAATVDFSNIPNENLITVPALFDVDTAKLMLDAESYKALRHVLDEEMLKKVKNMTQKVLMDNKYLASEAASNTDKEAAKILKKLEKIEDAFESKVQVIKERITTKVDAAFASEVADELKEAGDTLTTAMEFLREDLDNLNRGDRKEIRLLIERNNSVWRLESTATKHFKEIQGVGKDNFKDHSQLATPVQAAAVDQEAAGGDDDDSPDISTADDPDSNVSGPDVSGPGPDFTDPDDQAPKSGPGGSDSNASGEKSKSDGTRNKSKKRRGDNNDTKSSKKTKKTKTTNAAVT